MKKTISFIAISILLLVTPLLVIVDTVSMPFKAIGNLIAEIGDTSEVHDDVIELLNEFSSSIYAQDIETYIYENYSTIEERAKIDIDLMLLTSVLVSPYVLQDFGEEDIHDISDSDMFKYIDKAMAVYHVADSDLDYWLRLKRETMFKDLIILTTDTLMMYTDYMKDNAYMGSPENEFANKGDYRLDSAIYQSSAINPFIPTYRGQCTWFAWSRALEVTNTTMPTGNAGTWYDSWNGKKSRTPVENSVGVFTNGQWGHVIFIESFDGHTITFSESNYDNPCLNGSCDMVEYARINYKSVTRTETMPYSVFKIKRERGMSLKGYIY